MDANDFALSYRLKEQVDVMRGHPEVGLLGGAVEMISTTGQVIHTIRPPLQDPEMKSLILHYNPICHPAVVMRKEVARAAGGTGKRSSTPTATTSG